MIISHISECMLNSFFSTLETFPHCTFYQPIRDHGFCRLRSLERMSHTLIKKITRRLALVMVEQPIGKSSKVNIGQISKPNMVWGAK